MSTPEIERQLLPDEVLIVRVRRHPVFLSLPIAVALAAILVAASTAVIRQGESVRIIVWLVAAFFFAQSVARVFGWFSGYLVITSRQLLLRFGGIARDFATVNLSSIADIQMHRTARGRLIGYGDLVITVEGGGAQLVTYLPYPEQLYLVLGTAIGNGGTASGEEQITH